jgi:uncharacterized protein
MVMPVFARPLTGDEVRMIELLEDFVREKHEHTEGHDYSHVLEVTRHSIAIAERLAEPVDPFVLIAGALLHDVGRVESDYHGLHGLIGAAIIEELLHALGVDEDDREKIERVVARHTPTTKIPPQSVEEKIVFDADALERMGLMGLIRGVMGKKGSMAEILEYDLRKRAADWDKLHFDASRERGEHLWMETQELITRWQDALNARKWEVRHLELPTQPP